ncbi:MAG TPA: extracellular solute-binding protein [Thermoanaerobaculia bacterium]|jgi:iron(III) transport system substrate-binding protein|nr:extracellular solute-binding protein [Thermoanaerobaculia bacterium]
MKKLLRMLALAATLAMSAAACGGDNDGAGLRPAAPVGQASTGSEPANILTVYSRDREISAPLFELFEQKTGIKVRARWGDPIDLAGQIIEDGTKSPADVFYGPLSDALGALSAAGRLAKLSDEQLGRVPQAYRSPDGTWVGTSGRAHVVYYNTGKVREDGLPDSILGFTDPAWRGRIGWDPTSRSLQDIIIEVSQLNGEDAARRWLKGVQANAPAVIRGASPIIKAVSAGEIIDVGFGSHSYLYDLQADGDAMNVAAKFYRGGAPGGLLNVAGVGIIKGTGHEAAAKAFVDFMLSPAAQQHLAEDALEIPLAEGVTVTHGMPTAGELTVPGLDVRQFEQLPGARRLLTEAGIIG